MNATAKTIDCRGMRCPAPILTLSRASKGSHAPTHLQVLADDQDFPTDLRAWCRSTGARLESLADENGVFVADITLVGAPAAPEPVVALQAEAPSEPEVATEEVDCKGMRCPAPILEVARASKRLKEPTLLRVTATDGDFPTDLEAWCRSTQSKLFSMQKSGEVFEALIGLHGLEALPGGEGGKTDPGAPVRTQTQAPATRPEPLPAPVSSGSGTHLDLTAEPAGMVLARISQHAMANPDFTFVCPDSSSVRRQLEAWSPAMGLALELREEGASFHGRISKASGGSMPVATAAATAVAPMAPGGFPRENKATLLVLHNDFEPLMAALMVANASAAQGMDVEVFFSFWGVNMLRGPSNRPPGTEIEAKPGVLKSMMKMMMPAGPDNAQLSKMNFGGAGVGMMKHFMKQDNILSMRQLMHEAIELEVKFVVCTMSMGLMGIAKSDLMDLPNIEFGGVTAFSSSARTSATSMVF